MTMNKLFFYILILCFIYLFFKIHDLSRQYDYLLKQIKFIKKKFKEENFKNGSENREIN